VSEKENCGKRYRMRKDSIVSYIKALLYSRICPETMTETERRGNAGRTAIATGWMVCIPAGVRGFLFSKPFRKSLGPT
jgi:hypothetical protein